MHKNINYNFCIFIIYCLSTCIVMHNTYVILVLGVYVVLITQWPVLNKIYEILHLVEFVLI